MSVDPVSWQETGAPSQRVWLDRVGRAVWEFLQGDPDFGLWLAQNRIPVPVVWCLPCDLLDVPGEDINGPCSVCEGPTRPAGVIALEASVAFEVPSGVQGAEPLAGAPGRGRIATRLDPSSVRRN